ELFGAGEGGSGAGGQTVGADAEDRADHGHDDPCRRGHHVGCRGAGPVGGHAPDSRRVTSEFLVGGGCGLGVDRAGTLGGRGQAGAFLVGEPGLDAGPHVGAEFGQVVDGEPPDVGVLPVGGVGLAAQVGAREGVVEVLGSVAVGVGDHAGDADGGQAIDPDVDVGFFSGFADRGVGGVLAGVDD